MTMWHSLESGKSEEYLKRKKKHRPGYGGKCRQSASYTSLRAVSTLASKKGRKNKDCRKRAKLDAKPHQRPYSFSNSNIKKFERVRTKKLRKTKINNVARKLCLLSLLERSETRIHAPRRERKAPAKLITLKFNHQPGNSNVKKFQLRN